MTEALFYLFAGLLVISSVFILLTRNVLYAAFALVASLLSVAAMYVFAQAEFLAVTQIMIYVGGIIVLVIFGVMLTNKEGAKALVVKSHNRVVGVLIAAAMSTLLIIAILRINFSLLSSTARVEDVTTTNRLGIGIMTDYVLPFELTAVLLLVVLIAAISIGGFVRGKKNKAL